MDPSEKQVAAIGGSILDLIFSKIGDDKSTLLLLAKSLADFSAESYQCGMVDTLQILEEALPEQAETFATIKKNLEQP